jgi:hypothetical protein
MSDRVTHRTRAAFGAVFALAALCAARPAVAAPPAAPTNLTVAVVGKSIVLTWDDNSANEQGFKLERRLNTPYGNFPYGQFFRGTTPNQTTYTDSNVLPGGTYFYRVRAYGEGQNSGYSNEASVFLAPSGSSSRTKTERTYTISVTVPE